MDAERIIEIAFKAIDDEEEYDGDIPDDMWDAIKLDRDATLEALRITVRLTKEGIKKRFLEALREVGDGR